MEIHCNRSLKEYSTFKIGGIAKQLIEVKTVDEAADALEYARKNQLRWVVIGKGSNTLFSDQGFQGLAIVNLITHFENSRDLFKVGAGFSFAYLGIKSARLGFSGLEFASGIPGSVGGAVYMNAGAMGHETQAPLQSVLFLEDSGRLRHLHKADLTFRYRYSSFQEMPGMILEATFQLEPNPSAQKIQQEMLAKRIKTQPYSDPSIGCFFKNPSPNLSAGQLIDQCGLKGLSVGGAEVSMTHANFIVNKQAASASDVVMLKRLVQQRVLEKTGIVLEEEVSLWN